MTSTAPFAALRVAVVGLVGGACFGPDALAVLGGAEVVVGHRRHTEDPRVAALLTDGAVCVDLDGNLEAALSEIDRFFVEGRRVCVLASGDPGFFGIVRVLSARCGADRLEIHPAPSSVALAFARAGWSWDDAVVVSAHGRPLSSAVDRALRASKCAVLTSPDQPPELVGKALVENGCGPRDVVVVSRIGEETESVTHTDLSGLADGTFDPLSVVLLRVPVPIPDATGVGAGTGVPGLAWGLPEESFLHRDGMITKAEVRAVALGKLSLPSVGVLWDVGAGSGSVGIECARLRPGLRIIAIERSEEDADRIRANALAHNVDVEVIVGSAPEAFASLPDPDRVFVGGGGIGVLDAVSARLRTEGQIVATFVLLDRAVAGWERLGHMVQVSIGRAVTVGPHGPRLATENPVFVCWGP